MGYQEWHVAGLAWVFNGLFGWISTAYSGRKGGFWGLRIPCRIMPTTEITLGSNDLSYLGSDYIAAAIGSFERYLWSFSSILSEYRAFLTNSITIYSEEPRDMAFQENYASDEEWIRYSRAG